MQHDPTVGAPDVVDLLDESGDEPCKAGPSRPAPKPRAKPREARGARARKRKSTRFAVGNTIGKCTRFRRKKWKYRGACRECGCSDSTRNSGKDWFCNKCQVYTKKRRRNRGRR